MKLKIFFFKKVPLILDLVGVCFTSFYIFLLESVPFKIKADYEGDVGLIPPSEIANALNLLSSNFGYIVYIKIGISLLIISQLIKVIDGLVYDIKNNNYIHKRTFLEEKNNKNGN
jgi:hypothetical protein